MNYLLVILAVLVVVLLGALVMLYFAEKNSRPVEPNRKWTDPKFHD